MKDVLEEAKDYVLKNHDEMMKYILSRFIHKIIVKDTAIEVEYNLGGFFVEFKQVVQIKLSKDLFNMSMTTLPR